MTLYQVNVLLVVNVVQNVVVVMAVSQVMLVVDARVVNLTVSLKLVAR